MNDDFEREVIDRLGRIDERMKTIFNRLDAFERVLNGDGATGLTQRVRILENQHETDERSGVTGIVSRVQALEDQHKAEAKSKTAVVAWLAIILSAVSALIGFFKGGN